MQINPKVSAWVMGIITVLSVVTGFGAKGFPDYVPPGVALNIVQTAAIILAVVSALATSFHLYSSSQPGPLAPPDPQIVKDATARAAFFVKAIALAFILSALLHAGSAYAGEKVILAARGGQSAPSDIIAPAADAAAVPQGGPLAALSDLFASDFAAAATLSTATSIKDGNGQACWTAFGPFGEVLKAHPNAFTGKLATDLEAQRLAVIAARRLCDNVACNTVFTELAAGVQSVVSSLPISVSVNATPINVFAQACSHVPTLQVVAPAASALPTPTATPQEN
jgi:hypothetical protein